MHETNFEVSLSCCANKTLFWFMIICYFEHAVSWNADFAHSLDLDLKLHGFLQNRIQGLLKMRVCPDFQEFTEISPHFSINLDLSPVSVHDARVWTLLEEISWIIQTWLSSPFPGSVLCSSGSLLFAYGVSFILFSKVEMVGPVRYCHITWWPPPLPWQIFVSSLPPVKSPAALFLFLCVQEPQFESQVESHNPRLVWRAHYHSRVMDTVSACFFLLGIVQQDGYVLFIH